MLQYIISLVARVKLCQTLYLYVTNIHQIASSYIAYASYSQVLHYVFSRYRQLLFASLSQTEALNKRPLICSVAPIKLHILWAAVTWVQNNLAHVGQVALGHCKVKVRGEGLINTFIIFQDIFNNIVRLVDRVPLTVGVGMLHFDL